jgi:signal transduction histidine kinase
MKYPGWPFMTTHNAVPLIVGNDGRAALEAENRMLREEIRVSREAAEITAQLVVEQFEKTEAMLTRLQLAGDRLNASNAELEAANQRLQDLDKLKSDFLSSVSHELRTPLTSIRGFSQLINREFTRIFAPLAGDDPHLQKKAARIQENLDIILNESERLTRLINDVLDLAKIESGRTDWRDEPLQVTAFIQNAVNAAHGMFENKPEVALRLDIEEGLPPFIGDADRMLQVVVNLLNNAVKFTDHGEVAVKAFFSPMNLIQIEIRDTGIGFPQEEAETIFDKFQQAKQGDTLLDRPKGTGLGLAICREIVNRHGGHIWAQSQPGQGSIFSLTLPPAAPGLAETLSVTSRISQFADAKREEAVAGDALPRAGTRVLVVDDDSGVRDYFSQLLQEQGYEVITAGDGQAAIAAAKSAQPDLITMDLAMPVMDGRTAIAMLRADPELKHIPIMVISAIPGWDTAGGDIAMSKPLDEARFAENIHSLLDDTDNADARINKVNFLVLYEDGQSPAMVPGGFSAYCEIGFCPVGELLARVQAGFQGMVAIPANLLGRVDIGFLNATPALEVMIMPIQAAAGKTSPETMMPPLVADR